MLVCLPEGMCCSSDARACSSSHSLASYIFLLLHVLFIIAIFISFRVAFHENEDLITDPWATAKNYRRCVIKTAWPDVLGKCANCMHGQPPIRLLPEMHLSCVTGRATLRDARPTLGGGVQTACGHCRTRFYWDLAAWIPWDYIALIIMGDLHTGTSIVARLPLLRLLRLVSMTPSMTNGGAGHEHRPTGHAVRSHTGNNAALLLLGLSKHTRAGPVHHILALP